MLGVVSFLLLALCFAAVAAFAVAVIAAHARHVPTTAWFTATGLGDLFRALGDIALAVIGFSVLGLVIGQFLRSAVFGSSSASPGSSPSRTSSPASSLAPAKWLPGTALDAVAAGGTESASYAHGLIHRRRLPNRRHRRHRDHVHAPRRDGLIARARAPGPGRPSLAVSVTRGCRSGRGGKGPGDLRAPEGFRAGGQLGRLRFTDGGQMLLDLAGQSEERLIVVGTAGVSVGAAARARPGHGRRGDRRGEAARVLG